MSSVDPGLHYPIELDSLPRLWRVCYVGEAISDIQPGFASGIHNQEGKGVPHLRPMNIDRQGRLDLSVVKYVANSNGPRLRRGDILFNNTNSPELIGKTTAIETDADLAFSNHMTRLRPPDGVYGRFVAHQLHFVWMSGYFKHRCVKHVNQASIALSTLAKSIPLILPLFDEQRKIVAEIEKQFTRLDAAVAGLRRVEAKFKRYRAAVLKAACEGRLVPTEAEFARQEGRTYETGAQLLERILTERRKKWNGKGKYKDPEKPDTTKLPQLPNGWIWSTLGQVFDVYVGATPSRQRNDYWNGEIPWVSSGEVSFCRIRQTRERITELGLANSSTEIHPPGTILIGMIGEGRTRGQVAILDVAACNNQNSAAIRVSEARLPPEYTYYFLMSQYEQNRKLGSGNNQPALNKTRVQNISFPLPPVAEQQRLVDEVERRLSVVEELEAVVNANLHRATRLRQSILQRAFEGELLHTEFRTHLTD